MFSSWEKDRNPWVLFGVFPFPLMLQDSNRCLKGCCYEWEDNTRENEMPCPVSSCAVACWALSYFTPYLSVCSALCKQCHSETVSLLLWYCGSVWENWVAVLCGFNFSLPKTGQMGRALAQRKTGKELKCIPNYFFIDRGGGGLNL